MDVTTKVAPSNGAPHSPASGGARRTPDLSLSETAAGLRGWLGRNWDRAIVHGRQALELDHNFAALHWVLGHGYQGKGMYEEAIEERRRSVELSGQAPLFIAELGGTYAAAGKKEEALRILEQLHELSQRRYVMAYWIVLIHTGLRERDEALQWLEKASEERSPMLAWAKSRSPAGLPAL